MTTEQISSIITQFDMGQKYFVWQMSECNSDMDEGDRLNQFYENQLLPHHIIFEDDEKVLALMEHTGDNWDDCESEIDTKYNVYTDSEADESVDNRLEEYLDDNLLYDMDSAIAQYFDRDSWKSDNANDRGFWLSISDSEEYEEIINKTTYYIYKI